jgi:hypothetical protein
MEVIKMMRDSEERERARQKEKASKKEGNGDL